MDIYLSGKNLVTSTPHIVINIILKD